MAEEDKPKLEQINVNNLERKVSVGDNLDRTVTAVPKEPSLQALSGTVPEGQWGWMVVVSIFLLLAVCLGYVFSLSVFFVEWVTYFDASATEISWIVSLPPIVTGALSK